MIQSSSNPKSRSCTDRPRKIPMGRAARNRRALIAPRQCRVVIRMKTRHPPLKGNPRGFVGTVMISAERPARNIGEIVEGIVEQLTTLPDSEVSLKLEIDAEVPSGLEPAKVRTLVENAATLGFIDKSIT